MDIPKKERTLKKSYNYVDNYIVAKEIQKDIGFKLEKKFENLIPGYLGKYFYEGKWGSMSLAKKASTTIFNQIIDFMKAKKSIFEGKGKDIEQWKKDLKYVFYSAHESSISGFMTAIG